jgi:glycosyltransferase involved in cell wall biosynthesis
VREYQRSKIFLNTSLISPVPTVLLEAMSCGCAVVSTDTCMIPEFIKHGENGFMGKTAHELRYYVDLLRKDDKLASEMGNAARKTIVDNFSMNKFVSKWKEVFRRMI